MKDFKQLIVILSSLIGYEKGSLHNWRVGLIAGLLAERLIPEMVSYVYYGGLLHDL